MDGVDLRLRTAIHAKRDGFVEGIVRASTHRHECLAEQGEVDDDRWPPSTSRTVPVVNSFSAAHRPRLSRRPKSCSRVAVHREPGRGANCRAIARRGPRLRRAQRWPRLPLNSDFSGLVQSMIVLP
jgi:hypothetical protein